MNSIPWFLSRGQGIPKGTACFGSRQIHILSCFLFCVKLTLIDLILCAGSFFKHFTSIHNPQCTLLKQALLLAHFTDKSIATEKVRELTHYHKQALFKNIFILFYISNVIKI